MVEDPKNHESRQANESPMAALADEKSFEEHMADVNKEKNDESNAYLVDTAIESIASKLSLNKDELEKALAGDVPQDIVNKAQETIENEEIIDTLSDMHDEWCSKKQ